ncbi:hypothetical protein [Staphylospora marina]|uniref:hypothetical protein n=1 Tax=Staphylospora marina TaxID=2490858 RepID=UPI000F5BDB34|nr:hypothetical protein [Staphylospora marina]
MCIMGNGQTEMMERTRESVAEAEKRLPYQAAPAPERPMKRLVPALGWAEGVLFGGITGLGYFGAYQSELAYKEYYGLPSLYADVTINAVILAASSIVLVLFLILMFEQVPMLKRVSHWTLPVLLPFSAGMIIALRNDFKIHLSWTFLLGIFVVYALLTACLLVLFSRKQWFFGILLFIVLVISVSRASGYVNAANQREFLMIEGDEPMVVVDTYKEALIAMPVDRKTGTLKPEYRFIEQKTEFNESMTLKKATIGPFPPVKQPEGRD